MAPGKPCVHCAAKGCAIYATRPEDPCRRFECAWLRSGSRLRDRMRPDRCGAIVLPGRRFKGWDVIMATPTGWTIPPDTLEWLMAHAREQSLPLVWIENLHTNGVYTHFSRSGFGPAGFMRAIADPAEPLNIRTI